LAERELDHEAPAIRVGAVSYINALPLLVGLSREPLVSVESMPPSHVANGLRARSLDVGLVPSVELIRQPSLRVVSNACIASYGPVDSVLLLLRTEPQAVRHVVLDPHSRTSQVLTLIVLKELYGVEPEFELADPQAYNTAQTQEKSEMQALLYELCKNLGTGTNVATPGSPAIDPGVRSRSGPAAADR
jgi:chorismate dehydratase